MSLNKDLADALNEIADLLALNGDRKDQFRITAYQRGANILANWPTNIKDDPSWQNARGIGEGLRAKVVEFISTGKIGLLERLRIQNPSSLRELTKLPGIGPKRAKDLLTNYGIASLAELKKAFEEGRIKDERLKVALNFVESNSNRLPIYHVMPLLAPIVQGLQNVSERVMFAGSVRRRKETIKDVDILVMASDPRPAMDLFVKYGELIVRGDVKASIVLKLESWGKIRVDLLVIPKESWGSSLCYFTGSREHNIALRTLAKQKGYRVNEHGIYDQAGTKIGGEREMDLYALLGVPYVPPELREGEFVWHQVPTLIENTQVDGHVHSDYSDGHYDIMILAEAAKAQGLSTIILNDHITRKIYGTKLLEPSTRKMRKLQATSATLTTGVKVLCGGEVEVERNGLELSDEVLAELDWVTASLHTTPTQNVTERILKACECPYVRQIAHPSGRSFGVRPIAEADWPLIFKTCATKNIVLEINGQPDRLDLAEHLVKEAKRYSCKFILGSDTHGNLDHEYLQFAVNVARRGGLEQTDLVNP